MDDWELYFTEKCRRRARRRARVSLTYVIMGIAGITALALALAFSDALFDTASPIVSHLQARMLR